VDRLPPPSFHVGGGRSRVLVPARVVPVDVAAGLGSPGERRDTIDHGSPLPLGFCQRTRVAHCLGGSLDQAIRRRLEILGLHLELGRLVLELEVGHPQLRLLLLELGVGGRESAACRLAFGEEALKLLASADFFRHYRPVYHYARPRAVGLDEGVVDEVEEALLELAAGSGTEHRWNIAPDVGNSGFQNPVQQFLETLALQLGKRLEQRLADDVGPAGEIEVRTVGPDEYVIRTADNGKKGGRLLEDSRQVVKQHPSNPFGIRKSYRKSLTRWGDVRLELIFKDESIRQRWRRKPQPRVGPGRRSPLLGEV